MKKTIYDEHYSVLIDLLREYRERSRMTQQELAVLLECDQTYVSKYENKQRRLDIIELRNICLVLDTDLLSFIQEYEQIIKNTRDKQC